VRLRLVVSRCPRRTGPSRLRLLDGRGACAESVSPGGDVASGVGPRQPAVKARRPALGWLAAALVAASLAAGLVTICVRALSHTGPELRVLEGGTLFLAAGAYLAYALAHHRNHRELVTRSILVSAFLLWGIVQLAPGLGDVALLNDVAIVLFVADLAFLLSPWT
jgi:hypothetical protein